MNFSAAIILKYFHLSFSFFYFVLLVGVFLSDGQIAVADEVNTKCAPGDYGPDDRIGALNLSTDQSRRHAATLVRHGKVYALSIETGPDTPTFGRSYEIDVEHFTDFIGASNKPTFHDDFIMANPGIGTQLDGLGHFGRNGLYYNGLTSAELIDPRTGYGLAELGTDKVPPIVARGVLIDMTEYFGMDILPAGTVFNSADIQAAAAAQRVKLRCGDVVLFRTGWLDQLATPGNEDAFINSEPGIGVEGAQFLAELGVIAVGSDNWGLEVLPFEMATELFPVHQVLLQQNGVYILENIRTDELAADGVQEFMFVLGVPKLAGSVQAVITPVAIR